MKFRYLLKLKNGNIKYGDGAGPDEAARDAGVDPRKVKRSLPIEVCQTDEEKKERVKSERKRQRQRLKALDLARKARKTKLENRKHMEVNL